MVKPNSEELQTMYDRFKKDAVVCDLYNTLTSIYTKAVPEFKLIVTPAVTKVTAGYNVETVRAINHVKAALLAYVEIKYPLLNLQL